MATQRPTATKQQQRGNASVNPAPGASSSADKPLTTGAKTSLVRKFAAKYHVEDDKLLSTLKATAFRQRQKEGKPPPPEVTNEQMMALLIVADQYGLNPFTREIFAFPSDGGIVPIVSVDGWIRIINERPELSSIEFEYPGEGTPPDDYYVGCTITRKDRATPITVREYFKEVYRDTAPWNSHGRRMNRHKALIQCARVAFGFAGIFDPDEAERIANAMAIDSTAEDVTDRPRGKPVTAEPRALETQKAAELPAPASLDDQIKALLASSGVPDNELFAHFEIGDISELSDEQKQQAIDWLRTVTQPGQRQQ
ncbi:MAG: recombinase RecT [Terriglobales bacterium]